MFVYRKLWKVDASCTCRLSNSCGGT